MIRMFGYLAWRSAYNRLARQIRHLRSPRYVAALVVGVIGYVMYRYRIPPRGLIAMGGAAIYLISPIDIAPEMILGPLGLGFLVYTFILLIRFLFQSAEMIIRRWCMPLPNCPSW